MVPQVSSTAASPTRVGTHYLNGFRPCSPPMEAEGKNAPDSAFADGLRPSEPASSILAAHLPSHLASQGPGAHQLSRETFSQLRDELLGERGTQSRGEGGITDINKLICIILKAGLEVNPSGTSAEGLEQQVLDCLDIIQVSIERTPQALWDVADPLILGEDAHAPLSAWLILRLIKLAGTWSLPIVQEKIHQVFGTISFFQNKQLRPSPTSYNISAFLRACFSGMHHASANCVNNLILISEQTYFSHWKRFKALYYAICGR